MKRTLENKKYTEKMIDEKLIKRALQLFIRFLKEERAEEIAEALKKKINDIALAERERQ